MAPKLFELGRQPPRTLVLVVRGGTVAGLSNIDFFLEIEK
jgi:hypothetical protein